MTNVIELAKQAGIEFQENTGITGRKKVTTYGSQPIEKIELLIKLVRNAALEECGKTILEHSHSPETQRFSDARMSFYAAIESLKEPT